MIELSGLEFLCIYDCRIEKSMNSHGYGMVKGIIHGTDEKKLELLMDSDRMEQMI